MNHIPIYRCVRCRAKYAQHPGTVARNYKDCPRCGGLMALLPQEAAWATAR
jgi:DNA-directed RNA polymerase subunit RPC12/RpoP